MDKSISGVLSGTFSKENPCLFKVIVEMKKGSFGKKVKRLLCLSQDSMHFFDFPTGESFRMIKIADDLGETQKAEVTVFVNSKSKGQNKVSFRCCHRSFLVSEVYRLQDQLTRRYDKSFKIRKWNKKFQFVECELRFCSGSIVRLHKRIGSSKVYRRVFNMMDITDVYTYEKQRSIVVIKYEGYRVHFFKVPDPKGFISLLRKSAHKYLNISIEEKAVTEHDFLKLRNKSFISNDFYSWFLVKKYKEFQKTWEDRLLCINESFIVEKSANGQTVLGVHEIADVSCMVLKGEKSFSIEYLCESKMYRYRHPTRDSIIMDIKEMCKFCNINVSINIEETTLGMREGRVIPPNFEYSKHHFLRSFQDLTKKNLYEHRKLLREFNMSYRESDLDFKRRKLWPLFLSLLEFALNDEKQTSSRKGEMVQILLLIIQRLASCKHILEEVANHSELFQNSVIRALFYPVSGENNTQVRFFASQIVIYLLSSPHIRKTKMFKQHAILLFKNENIIYIMQTMVRDGYNKRFALTFHNLLGCFEQVFKNDSMMSELINSLVKCLFASRSILYHFCRSDSLALQLQAVRVLTIVSLRLKNKELMVLQKDVLENGLLLKFLFKAMYTRRSYKNLDEYKEMSDEDFADIVYSLEKVHEHSLEVIKECLLFVDLMISFYKPAISFIKQILPAQFIKDTVKLDLVRKDKVSPLSQFTKKRKKLTLQTQDWVLALEKIYQDCENISIVWNNKTRDHLKKSLRAELNLLTEMETRTNRNNFIWNHEDYKFDYVSCIDEIRIGKYYLRFLGDEKEELKISDPLFYLKQICYAFFFEEEEEKRLIFINSIKHVYSSFLKGEVFPYLRKVVLKLKNSKEMTIELLTGILKVVDLAMKRKENVFAINDIFVPLLAPYIKKVHTEDRKYGEIIGIILNIFYYLSSSHSVRVAENQRIFPVSTPTKILSSDDVFPYLVQMLLYNGGQTSKILNNSYKLLFHLLQSHQSLIPNLYKSGFFYFLFANEYGLCEMSVRLLKLAHKKQKFKRKKFGLEKGKSFLLIFFPEKLLEAFEKETEKRFLEIFDENSLSQVDLEEDEIEEEGEEEKEEFENDLEIKKQKEKEREEWKLIWNENARLRLQTHCENHVLEFKTSMLTNEFLKYYFTPLKRVKYPELEKKENEEFEEEEEIDKINNDDEDKINEDDEESIEIESDDEEID